MHHTQQYKKLCISNSQFNFIHIINFEHVTQVEFRVAFFCVYSSWICVVAQITVYFVLIPMLTDDKIYRFILNCVVCVHVFERRKALKLFPSSMNKMRNAIEYISTLKQKGTKKPPKFFFRINFYMRILNNGSTKWK